MTFSTLQIQGKREKKQVFHEQILTFYFYIQENEKFFLQSFLKNQKSHAHHSQKENFTIAHRPLFLRCCCFDENVHEVNSQVLFSDFPGAVGVFFVNEIFLVSCT